jgi:hypothetical protein
LLAAITAILSNPVLTSAEKDSAVAALVRAHGR